MNKNTVIYLFNKYTVWFVIITLLLSTMGCATTSLYGGGLTKIKNNPDQYTLRVVTGGWWGLEEAAEKRANEEVASFMMRHQEYKSYELTVLRNSSFPSYTIFKIIFTKLD